MVHPIDTRRVSALVFALVAALAVAGRAEAGAVIDRIRAQRLVHCASRERPGLLTIAPGGVSAVGAPRGLLADLCRAVGVAVAGPDVRLAWSVLEADASYDAMNSDDLVFLDGGEIVDHKLAGSLLPGPTVVFDSTSLMVPEASPAHHPSDLARQPICFLQGEAPHRGLEAWFAAHHLDFVRMGYQEPDEMADAFDAAQCKAVAGRTTDLAALRLAGGPRRGRGRILEEALTTWPIIAATGTADAAWAAAVGWTIATLQNADRPAQAWTAEGIEALPIEAPGLGLAAGWQRTLLRSAGSYGSMVRRDLGRDSPLGLPPGPNALAADGGLLGPPAAP